MRLRVSGATLAPGVKVRETADWDTLAKRALYDNLDKDETLALAVHEAVYANRQDDWRNNAFKVKRVRNAIKAALKDDESDTERVLELVKNQHEY